MEFTNVVGSRRSIRWFRTWQPVETEKVQRILEAARLTGCPGNLQPWRAVVVEQTRLSGDDRAALLDAANHQRAHEQAPVWIYWFADPTAAAGSAFLFQIRLGLEVGALAASAGWDADAAASAIESGVAAPPGMAPLDQIVHAMPPEVAGVVASQETVGAITVATLAAVDAGLGTCLHIPTSPAGAPALYQTLGVPAHFLPVWLQLIGYPAEDPRGGGARPREDFGDLFSYGRWGEPMPRDAAVVEGLRAEGLLQPEAPLPGRAEELRHLARMFGYSEEA
jgi:nitroreductase